MSVHDRLSQLLADVPHERLEHPAVQSAAHAAELRGTPARIGGKALVMKLKKDFAILALGGDARLDGRQLRKTLGVQRYRMATREELLQLAGLTPGSVPPIGRPLFPLPLFMDQGLAQQTHIAFTLACPTVSAILTMPDYLALARPDAVVPLTAPQDR